MGLALRTGELLTLDLPSIVWKYFVDDPITEEDVMAIDRLSFKIVHELRKLENIITTSNNSSNTTGSASGTPPSITADEFKSYIDSSFVVIGSDQKQHELIPGGESIPVTWSNRDEFVSALLWYRKHEFALQCLSIRNGLSQVVPIAQLSILTWKELRSQVCAEAFIDCTLLKK